MNNITNFDIVHIYSVTKKCTAISLNYILKALSRQSTLQQKEEGDETLVKSILLVSKTGSDRFLYAVENSALAFQCTDCSQRVLSYKILKPMKILRIYSDVSSLTANNMYCHHFEKWLV